MKLLTIHSEQLMVLRKMEIWFNINFQFFSLLLSSLFVILELIVGH